MNHFLLRQTDGSHLYLYYDKKNASLSLQRYTHSGLGNHNITILQKNIEPDFNCDLDNDGNLHVAFSTVTGHIHYGYFSKNTFRSFPILAAKNPSSLPKHICILAKTQPITVFYVVHYDGKQLLSMQKIDNTENTFSSPVAIDYLLHPKQNFAAGQQEDGTLYLAYNHILRTLTSDGNVIKQKEILQTCETPLFIDHFSIDKKTNLTLLAHTLPYSFLYFYCAEQDLLQTIDLTPYPRTQNTFFGLAKIEKKTHCYFCTERALYDSIQEIDTFLFPSFQKQTKPYSGAVSPICYITEDKQLLLPGNVVGRQFFYLYNPFSAEAQKNIRVAKEQRISQLEKRVSALEEQITRFLEKL